MTALPRHLGRVAVVGTIVAASAAPGLADAGNARIGDRSLALHVVDQTFAVGADEPFTATIEVSGAGSEIAELTDAIRAPAAVAATPATVRVHAHPTVTTADQLHALERDGTGGAIASVEIPAAEVFTDPERLAGAVTIPIAGARSMALPDGGIAPLTIEVVTGAEVVASTTTFAQLVDLEPNAEPALAVAIMAGVADPGPWPSPTELSSASIEIAELVALADAVDGPLSISLPPGLLSALTTPAYDGDAATTADAPDPTAADTNAAAEPTVLAGSPGQTDPAYSGLDSADAVSDAFRGDELFALPAIALDPSSLAAVDQTDLFTEQLRTGEDVLSSASLRGVASRSAWFSRGAVSDDAMTALRDLGIRLLVVPATTATELGALLAPGAGGIFAVDLAGDGTLPAIAVGDLGAGLAAPVDAAQHATANELAVRLLAELQLQRAASGTPAVVLATPRFTVPDPAITAQFVELATQTPDVAVVPMSRLPGIVDRALTDVAAAAVTLPQRAGIDLSERLARVAQARLDASHASRMLVEPGRGEAWDADLTRVLSTAIDDVTAVEHLAATESEIDRVLTAIVPPESDTFRLTGTSSTLRLRLENTYDQPLTVTIHVRSPKLRFPEPDPLETIGAGEARLVEIPVEARTNGTFTIEVDVLAPDRTPVGDPVILKARVTRFTGLSQVVTGAAVLVLVSWWYSHFRRDRRRQPAGARPDL